MTLDKYQKKRSFTKTPEPKGKMEKAGRELRFVVQEHHASHLHYDFRLEMEGVLKSWAVPKGPSMTVGLKRLAMMVEDHPVSYIGFHGTIPKGNYGAGEVFIWDSGVYHSSETLDPKENKKKLSEGLRKGHLKFVLLGKKLQGLFSLVKMKDAKQENAWLLIKEKDILSSPSKNKKVSKKAKFPHNIKPMLARLTDKPFNRKNWIFEIKWDGYRAIAEVEKGKVNLYSRNNLSFERYKPVVEALKKVKDDVVFDGEIVAIKNGRPDFHALQNYETRAYPLRYVIFDLLYINGEDLRSLTLRERRERLKEIFPKNPIFILSEGVDEKGENFFQKMVKEKFEGMIAKDLESKYIEGVRTDSWLKVKNFNEQEAVIIGFTKPRGSRKHLGALVLGAFDKGKLKYIGHSGGGFTEKELKEVYELLNKIKISKSPVEEKVPINSPITWVKPKYVSQVHFSEWTPDGLMRHPIYKGLREDKKPEEVKIEKVENKNKDKVSFTNTDKVFWPQEGYTKGDVINYYEKISSHILPYLLDRPESLNRHPHGIEGKNFFQKDITMKLPDFVETAEVWSDHNGRNLTFLLCQNKETLLYLANLGCIEINPWSSRVEKLDNPDYMIIDLDPGENTLKELIKVAEAVHEVLEMACERHFLKTSGKTGLHILVPLGGKYDYKTIRDFSGLLVRLVHKKVPNITSIERSPSKRRKKIYLDYLQNSRGQTIAAPYSLRPAPGAPVSTPLEWKELTKSFDPRKFNIKTIFKRLEKKGDLFEHLLTTSVDLKKSIKCLETELGKIN
jgi:bifunctional non-homologous end joining protein LigD